jgi:hypothetical protein
MAVSSDHITGFAVGLGAAALGFYLYKNNQSQVDQYLRKYGIEVPSGGSVDAENMSLEELVAEKEKLEDLIAEREYAATQEAKETPVGEKAKRGQRAKKTRAKKGATGS